MKVIGWISALALCLCSASLLAQTDTEELTLEIINAKKKLIVLENMGMTEEEKEKFWPVYEEYQTTLDQLNQRDGKLIEEFAANYNDLTDEAAKSLIDQYFSIEKDRLTAREDFLPKFSEALPPNKVIRYYQIEEKLDAIVNFELARLIPLAK